MLAAKLVRTKPEAAAAIKAGKSTVGKATRDISKEQNAKAELDAAHGQIEKICGAELAKAIKNKILLKQRKDVIAFAQMTDAEMRRVQGLIANGWPLKKARLYRAKNLTLRHSINDLVNKAISTFPATLSVDIERWRIRVMRLKSALRK